MLIVSTFEHSIELEQALAVIEQSGIHSSHILAVPMDASPDHSFSFSSEASEQAHRAFGVGMACATACGVLGTAYGFVLAWGPLIWGLAAAIGGFGVGYGIYRRYFAPRSQERRLKASILPEVTLIIRCNPVKSFEVCKLLWQYHALTVGTVHDQADSADSLQ